TSTLASWTSSESCGGMGEHSATRDCSQELVSVFRRLGQLLISSRARRKATMADRPSETCTEHQRAKCGFQLLRIDSVRVGPEVGCPEKSPFSLSRAASEDHPLRHWQPRAANHNFLLV